MVKIGEPSVVKIGELSTKLGLLSSKFLSLYDRGHIPLGVWVRPSATNDHHLGSFHKGYLWRLLQHMQQFDLI